MDKTRAIETIKILDAIIEYQGVSKILNTFYAAFHSHTIVKPDGVSWLHGSFNLGGTISGRLSHSDPNLGNLPSTGTKWAKAVKQGFQAPEGWVIIGADYASLEDRISALITRDIEKLKVYIAGYDGHCLRAYAYYGRHMPDIDPYSVDSINSIAQKYPEFRQKSKVPTFCLTYGGTWIAIVEQTGIPEEEAKEIEANYHRLYHQSDQFIADRLEEACSTGYVVGAFGLRLRTPILRKTFLGSVATPYEAEAEGRSAGNMVGQSFGMLNNRSTNEFMTRVWSSEHAVSILPINQIHDASYFIARKDPKVIQFANQHLIECMEWQDLEPIRHDQVGLGGELSIFAPSWADEIVVPNNATLSEISQLLSTIP